MGKSLMIEILASKAVLVFYIAVISWFQFLITKFTAMGILKDFKDFAMKGNILDLAVAVVIGGAFGTIVSSMVDDVITPLLLTPALKAANASDLDKLTWGSVKYGKFLAAIIKFIVIAFVLFLIVKAANAAIKKKAATPPAPAAPPEDIALLREIRDALKK